MTKRGATYVGKPLFDFLGLEDEVIRDQVHAQGQEFRDGVKPFLTELATRRQWITPDDLYTESEVLPWNPADVSKVWADLIEAGVLRRTEYEVNSKRRKVNHGRPVPVYESLRYTGETQPLPKLRTNPARRPRRPQQAPDSTPQPSLF